MMIVNRLMQYFRNIWILRRIFSGHYKFTIADMLMYLQYAESPGPKKDYPTVRTINASTAYNYLEIGEYRYCWPKMFGINALLYMHQEVFEPADDNPHAYEYEALKLAKGDICIDAGACEGFFTRYALERGARVIAIEPVTVLVNALKHTYSEEIEAGSVSIYNAAIGLYTGQGHLYSDSTQIYESRLDNYGEEIDIIKLDDLITTKIDFIKMDIEGGEVDALYGAKNVIQQYKPKLSIAVYHEYENAREIMEFLQEICPSYTILHRGIFAHGGVKPRPMMVYAW